MNNFMCNHEDRAKQQKINHFELKGWSMKTANQQEQKQRYIIAKDHDNNRSVLHRIRVPPELDNQ